MIGRGLIVTFLAVCGLATAVWAQTAEITPAEAYAKGCGGCHTSERTVLRKIPRVADDERRAWITQFISCHPCEADALKPRIVDYLMQKTAK